MADEIPIPGQEQERLDALLEYEVLDTPPEAAFDDLTELAAFICGAPTALVSLVDRDRQWFKSRQGMEATETPRSMAFCAHAVARPEETLVVQDATRDERFASNPLVTGPPGVRFYAGAPLRTPTGLAVGTLCVIDYVPRALDARQRRALEALSRQVTALLELRKSLAAQRSYHARLERANRLLTLQAITDPLTLLLNRRGLDERLAEELARARRSETALSLFMLDADRFKAFNDTFGHQAGDDVLRELAEILKASLRPYDRVARYGGEEFAVVLPGTGLEAARGLAERIRLAVADHPWAHRAVTVSIGIANLVPGDHAAGLIARADHALYRAKSGGRNRVEIAVAPHTLAGDAAPD